MEEHIIELAELEEIFGIYGVKGVSCDHFTSFGFIAKITKPAQKSSILAPFKILEDNLKSLDQSLPQASPEDKPQNQDKTQ